MRAGSNVVPREDGELVHVTLEDAGSDLARLVEQAARGEVFVITRDGRPLVKVVPAEAAAEAAPRYFGFLAGQIAVPDDFDRMGEAEIAHLFGNR